MASLGKLDAALVFLYFLITLAIGSYLGKNNKDIKDYAIGGKTFNTLALVLTFLATAEGGATIIGIANNVCADGIIMAIAFCLGTPVSHLFAAKFIAPKMNNFAGSISIGDLMGRLYGKNSRIVTGIIGLLHAILIVASQMLALSCIATLIPGIREDVIITISGLIVVIYASIGGIKSVVITDMLQFIIILVTIPVIAYLVTKQVGGIPALFEKLPVEKLTVFGHKKFYHYLVLFFVWGLFPAFQVSPPLVQRLLMAQNTRQLSIMFLSGAAFIPLFTLPVTVVGLGTFSLHPAIDAKLVFPHMISKVLPIGIKGLTVAGMFAAVMSTADSFLNSAGVLFTHDIVKSIADRKGKVIDELKVGKYATFIIGCIAIGMALTTDNIIQLMLAGAGLLGSVITIPLIAGILGIKTEAKAFFIALAMSTVAFVMAKLTLKPELHYLVPVLGIIVNATGFFGVHFTGNKGGKSV